MKSRFMTAGRRIIALLVSGGLLLSGMAFRPTQVTALEATPGSVVDVPTKLGYGLVFQEEFEDTTLDDGVWMDEYFPHAYAANVDNAARYTLEDGVLSLTIQAESPGISGDMKVSSIQTYESNTFHLDAVRNVETFNGFTAKYGYFEIRAKLPNTTNGGHAAWWMVGATDDPAENAEIDILEALNAEPSNSHPKLHPWDDSTLTEFSQSVTNNAAADGFHTYGMLWEEDLLVFYYDGQEIARTNQAPDYEMGMLLSVYNGTDWSGAANNDYPFSFDIDYVRVYQRSLGANATVTWNDATMTGSGLQLVNDGDPSSQFMQSVSQDPTVALDNHYIQFNWTDAVEVNQVVLSSDWCYKMGASEPEGQAPTNWDIYVSENGTDNWKLVAATGDITWETCSDVVESKAVQFDTETVKGLRVKINDVDRSWQKYVIKEIDIACVPVAGHSAAEPVEHASNAVVSYNDGVMTGNGLQNVKDGNLTNAYVSEDAPDLSEGKQYIQFTWENAISFDQVTLYAQYCGSASTQGQAPTNWDIYVSENGTDGWSRVGTSGAVEWEAGDAVQSEVTNLELVSNVKGVRVVITAAKLDWNHYAVNEILITDTGTQSDPDSGDGGNQAPVAHASSAVVTYNDGVMNGQGLQNVKDGNLTDNAYVSEDNPDMSDGKQYIQFNWETAIDVDQVVLHSRYCGTDTTDGQAPTAWDIYVSENGIDGWTKVASSGTVVWEAGNDPQSKTVNFDKETGIKGVRVVITAAKLEWNHYSVYELEINDIGTEAPEGDGGNTGGGGNTGDNGNSDNTVPSQPTYHIKDAVISYNDGVMTGQGLQNVKGDSHTNAYVSEDNPDMSDGKQYIQMNWEEAISFNQVVLYSQYCGTSSTDGQAPTSWDIYVSENGTDGWTKVATSGTVSWAAGDDLQSKETNLARASNVKGIRVVITSANLSWGHYAVYGLEVNNIPDADSNIPSTGDQSTLVLAGAVMMLCAVAVVYLVCDQRKNKDTVR